MVRLLKHQSQRKNGGKGLVTCVSFCTVLLVLEFAVLLGQGGRLLRNSFGADDAAAPHYPLVMGDQSIYPPINMLMDNNGRQFQKIHCKSFLADNRFSCAVEWDEWVLATAFVQPNDVVLEFGARYGTTSCILARAAGQGGVVVAVEPDRAVHHFLLENGRTHHCGYHTLLGTVGPPQYMDKRTGYGTSTTTEHTNKNAVALPSMKLSELEQALHSRRFTVALIDCEGCIAAIDQAGVLDRVDVILMEEDNLPSYALWHQKLYIKGFVCHWYIKDTSNWNEASKAIRHSAWVRKSSGRKYLSCLDYAATSGIAPELFQCDVCPLAASAT